MKDYSHLTSENSDYVDQLFEVYTNNPDQLSSDWKNFFDGVEFSKKFTKGTSDFAKESKAVRLIEAYRNHGHRKANLDPLGLQNRTTGYLDLARYGLTEKDLKESFEAGHLVFGRSARLEEIISFLESVYCGTFAVQMEDVVPDEREWLVKEIEGAKKYEIPTDAKREIFDYLIKAEGLEKFLHTRYVGVKRFSVEGSENVIPILNKIGLEASIAGCEEIVIGMAHRGRLNILVNFMGKDFRNLVAEFDGKENEGPDWFTGDVKYHMGYSNDRKLSNNKMMHFSLAFNPSHLETVNPILEGMSWVKQKGRGGKEKVLPVQIHGDAAFIGQGVVSETLQMSQLQAYNTGGSIHICIDNQVGFTTDPQNSRTSRYSSDVMKALQVPVFHANGDDAEACMRAAELAIRYRTKFAKDVCVRLSSYRKHGHNEGDEPAYTQPVMYEVIKTQPTPREQYQKRLEADGVLAAGEGVKLFDAEINRLQKLLDEARTTPPKLSLGRKKGLWSDILEVNIEEKKIEADTAISEKLVTELAEKVLIPPTEVEILPKLKNVIEKRMTAFHEKKLLDWGGAELLAYASLVNEGTNVRLVGQDAQRGTFSHRHAVYHDYKTNKTYNTLTPVSTNAQFHVYDSLLSEYAALGFEYGISSSNPKWLTIWEAQFGDFVNGAQIIIDQYVTAGEQKWQQMSGLVMLLPHGFEGQGPEHSSARLERFLQSSAQGNIQVCNVTTPAQMFHMMRRQIKRNVRKPLIVMSPKSLFRHPKVISEIKEFTHGKFNEMLGDAQVKDTKQTKRVILCTGKLYYDLLDEREKLGQVDNIALVRVEQIYPFPHADILQELKRYPNVKDLIWAQEEPENMGALFFVRQKMNKLKQELARKEMSLGYIARPERSSPAVGSPYRHKHEQEEILKKAFHIG